MQKPTRILGAAIVALACAGLWIVETGKPVASPVK